MDRPQIPKAELTTAEQLETVRTLLYDYYMPQMKLYEYFMLDMADILERFEKEVLCTEPPGMEHTVTCTRGQLQLIQDPDLRRLKSSIDFDLALTLYNMSRSDCDTEEKRILKCCSELKKSLNKLNHEAYSNGKSYFISDDML